jgi:muramoyltetrapeptide carboxypeptidase LdcA involved in peptidoglycan recycling
VKLAPGIWERDDYVAGSPQQRADDLNALFGDAEVDVVQVLQGGFGSAELEKCDYGDTRQVSDWARSRSLEDVLEERLEPLGVPVLYGLPLGHGKHLAALPLGVTCTLDADARTLTVEEAALR